MEVVVDWLDVGTLVFYWKGNISTENLICPTT